MRKVGKSITIRNKAVPIWLLALIIASIFIAVVAAAYVYELTIPGTVIVEETPSANYSVEVYEDFECTKPLTSIDFGKMKPGEFKYVTIYLKNTGTGTITKIESITEVTGRRISFHKYVDFKPGDVVAYDIPIGIASDATPGSHSVTITLKFVA
jgi:hypothetical protein